MEKGNYKKLCKRSGLGRKHGKVGSRITKKTIRDNAIKTSKEDK